MHHGELLLTYGEIPSNHANLPSTTTSKSKPANLDLVSMATLQTVLMMAFMKSTVFTSQSGLNQHTVDLAGLPRSVAQSDKRMFGTRAPRGRYAPHSRNDSNHLSPGWVCPYKEWRPLSLCMFPKRSKQLIRYGFAGNSSAARFSPQARGSKLRPPCPVAMLPFLQTGRRSDAKINRLRCHR